MAAETELVDRVRQALAAVPSVREVAMFGGLSFMVADQMVVSARGDGELLVRADPARADVLLALEGARPAEMGSGRPMSKSWISVSKEAITNDEDLGFWLGVALEYNQVQRAASRRSGHSRRAHADGRERTTRRVGGVGSAQRAGSRWFAAGASGYRPDMTTTQEQGPGASDLGKSVIKTRKVTHWQPNFSPSGSGEPGTYLFQLVLDHGASEVVLALTADDADNLFDWLRDSDEAYYDLEREVLLFGSRTIG